MSKVDHAVYEYTTTRTKIGEVGFQLAESPEGWYPQIPVAMDLVRPYFEKRFTERLLALYFDNGGQLIGLQVIADGDLISVAGDPQMVMREVLAARASSFALFHNHPNGSVKPSESDKMAAMQVINAATALNILYVDSVVVNDNCTEFVSLRQLAGQERLKDILGGKYIPRPQDYDFTQTDEIIRAASEMRIAANANPDHPKIREIEDLVRGLEMTAAAFGGDLGDPLEMLRRQMLDSMGFDPDGDDGLLN